MLTLTSSTSPAVSSTTFSRIGPSVKQGPHQGAQRATTTGTSADRYITSSPNVRSVTSVAMPRRYRQIVVGDDASVHLCRGGKAVRVGSARLLVILTMELAMRPRELASPG